MRAASIMRIQSRIVAVGASLGRQPPAVQPIYSAFRPALHRLPPRRLASSIPEVASAPSPAKPSFFRRAASVLALGVVFTSLGFKLANTYPIPTIMALVNAPSDEETLSMFSPQHDLEHEVEKYINNHPLTKEMRTKEGFIESRPHLKIPDPYRSQNLTAGVLLGPGKVVVPPIAFTEEGGKSIVSIYYLGNDVCGHPGIVHGGLLATMLDEGLARCCFAALPFGMGVTANLNINYRAPTMANSYVVLKATTTKVEGRKAWVDGRIETLVDNGEKPVVLAEATALYISPKQAALMTNIFPTK